MDVNPLSAIGVEPGSSPARARSLSGQDFFRLLLTQMRSQSPLEPVGNTEFLAQLAQFSALDQMSTLNTRMDSLQASQSLITGTGLIGRNVEYFDAATGGRRTGAVTGATIESGQLLLEVDGRRLPLSWVLKVLGLATPAPTTPGPNPNTSSAPAPEASAAR
jgi:flagellar basal-body rod modification protein FlgD